MGERTVVLVGGNNGGKEHLLQELLGRRQGGAWCYSYRHITYDLRLLPLCALQSPALRGADCTVLVTPALAGVTDVTGGSKTTVNTVVRNNYTDTHEKKTFALTGKTTTFEGAAGYFGAESGTLTVGFPDLREVEITYTVSVDTVVMTVTNYDDLPDGTYTCPEREDKSLMTTIYTGSKLTYTGTDYEDGKVTINEIRDDYYNRHHIWRGYTLTVTSNAPGITATGVGSWNNVDWSALTQGGGQTTGGYSSPKTFDAGTALYAVSAVLSGAGAAVLRRRKR